MRWWCSAKHDQLSEGGRHARRSGSIGEAVPPIARVVRGLVRAPLAGDRVRLPCGEGRRIRLDQLLGMQKAISG